MKNKKERKSRFSRFIQISLIIHIILILIFFMFAFRQEAVEKFRLIKLQDPKKDPNELPAALKPRKSEFGLVSFVDDIPKFTPPESKIVGKQKQKGKQKIKTTSKPPKKTRTKKEKPIIKNKIKELDQTKKENDKKEDIDNELEKKEYMEKLKEQTLQLTQTNTQIEPMNIEMLKTFGADKKDNIPDVKPKKSIVGMTQGFIENLKQEGNDWLKRDGDENKRPSYEELKYLSYQQTIVWHLQATWKQRFLDKSRHLPLNLSPIIYFVIDENGNVENIDLAQTCGNTELDKVFVRLIQETSPFPPIPKHFNQDKFKTGGHFTIVSNQFDV